MFQGLEALGLALLFFILYVGMVAVVAEAAERMKFRAPWADGAVFGLALVFAIIVFYFVVRLLGVLQRD